VTGRVVVGEGGGVRQEGPVFLWHIALYMLHKTGSRSAAVSFSGFDLLVNLSPCTPLTEVISRPPPPATLPINDQQRWRPIECTSGLPRNWEPPAHNVELWEMVKEEYGGG